MMKSIYRRISFIVVQFLIGIFLCSALLVGCETDNTFTSDDKNVYITCGPLAQIESDTEPLEHYAVIEDIKSVYDADTITDVLVLLHKFNRPQTENLSLWPGVQRYTDGIYSITDIRIRGIDAPEFKRVPKGSVPDDNRERHKTRGVNARDFLRNLIEKSSINGIKQAIKINIFNEEDELYGQDKYGRILSDVFCYHNGEEVNVSEALIEAHHAVAYDGGTKTFDWGAEVLDFDDVVEEEE